MTDASLLLLLWLLLLILLLIILLQYKLLKAYYARFGIFCWSSHHSKLEVPPWFNRQDRERQQCFYRVLISHVSHCCHWLGPTQHRPQADTQKCPEHRKHNILRNSSRERGILEKAMPHMSCGPNVLIERNCLLVCWDFRIILHSTTYLWGTLFTVVAACGGASLNFFKYSWIVQPTHYQLASWAPPNRQKINLRGQANWEVYRGIHSLVKETWNMTKS